MRYFGLAMLAVACSGVTACSDGNPDRVEATGDTVEVVVVPIEDRTPTIVIREQIDEQQEDSLEQTAVPEKSMRDSIADLSRQLKDSFKIE